MIFGKRVWSDCITRGTTSKKVTDVLEELSKEGRDFLSKYLNQNSLLTYLNQNSLITSLSQRRI